MIGYSLSALLGLTASLLAFGPGDSLHPEALVAEIDNVKITMGDLERKNSAALFQARTALYDAERKALDELINDYVLERQAKREGLTVEQLLKKHVDGKADKAISEEALRLYYENIDTTESFDAVRGKILDAMRQRRVLKLKTAYIQSLRREAAVVLRVEPPRAQLNADNAPMRGNAGAAVKIVEYADYECPYCQQIQPAVAKLEAEFKGRVSFAFKDVPLPMHANAQKAAEAAHCAGSQGQYWSYHDLLFESKRYDLASLKEHASTLHLDVPAFTKCLESGSQAATIKAHVAEAQSIRLPGTPGFFINGRFVDGAVDYDILRRVVEEELVKTAPTASAGSIDHSRAGRN